MVASILLAFAIDAWWGNRLENDAKNTMLRAIREDMLDNQRWLKEERVYRVAARESDQALLRAIAAGSYEDTEKTLDHRLSDLLWFSGPGDTSGMVEGLLSGGHLAAIEDEALRRALTSFPGVAQQFLAVSEQDKATFTEVLTPFLSRNASLPQISNVSFKEGRPGDGWGADPEGIVPAGKVVDHSHLLRNQEFAGIITRKLWNDSDVLFNVEDFAQPLRTSLTPWMS